VSMNKVRKSIFDSTSKADLFYALQSRFDSTSKADLFYALQSQWCHRFRVYPSLLLSKIIEIDPDMLSPKQRRILNKSAVDLTFCDLDGRPLFSIDVDEVGDGFSCRDVYNEGRNLVTPDQKEEIEFKLKVANTANYPLIVMSDEEIQPMAVDDDESFRIVDGIIGQFVTIAETKKLLDDKPMASETEIEEIESEVATEINPIVKKANEYCELSFGDSDYSSSVQYFYDPPRPVEAESSSDDYRRAVMSRPQQDTALRVGCRVVIEAPDHPDLGIEETVWVRNFGSYIGWDGFWSCEISARSLARDIAKYRALKKAFLVLAQSF
jgi:hypothetical protein